MCYTQILSVLLLICVVKCNSMSKSELEDFSNFLKRTSSLDQTLKKTPGVGAFDEDEPISDINAWEESGKFEGDLILNDRQRRVIVEDVAEGLSRNGLKDTTKRWPDNMVIFYIQREHFNGEQVRAIFQGIEDLARASCVKFRPYKKGDRDAVVVQGSRRGCFSQVGYQGGYQVLNLSGRHPVGRGCFRHGTIVHEFLHTLGFYHMQSSPDRDDYIDVRWENIVQPAKHNFRKYNTFSVSDFGVGYDYDSVLHYSRKAFSSNGRDTLVPKQDGTEIGQRLGLSDKDTQKLNKMYCDADNNDEEQTVMKPNKKRKRKNRPFDGHGIGYHQGKTLVIKVPTTATIQVTSMPIYRSFDYSSKLPSTPIVQRVGTGQEIVYWSYPLSLYNNRNKQAIHRTEPQKFTDVIQPQNLQYPNESVNTVKTPNIIKSDNNEKHIEGNNTKSGELDEMSKKEEAKKISDVKAEEITAALKRLEDLVKSRLVPIEYNTDYSKYQNHDVKLENDSEIRNDDKLLKSPSPSDKIITTTQKYSSDSPSLDQTRQFIKSLYNTNSETLPETQEDLVNTRLLSIGYNADYSKYQNHDIKMENDSEIRNVDKLLKGPSNSSKINTTTQKYSSPNLDQTHEFIRSLYNTNSELGTPKDTHGKIAKDTPDYIDSSYRTSYPFKNLDYHKENHELAEYKYDPIHKLSDKYSNLYQPTDEANRGSAIKTHQKVFGDNANPLGEHEWYRKVELNNTPLRHDKDRYTYKGLAQTNEKPRSDRHSGKNSAEDTDTTANYSLFGKSVPTSSKWFKEHLVYEPRYPENNSPAHENKDNDELDNHNQQTNTQSDEYPNSEENTDESSKAVSKYSQYTKPVTANPKWFDDYPTHENPRTYKIFNKNNNYEPDKKYTKYENLEQHEKRIPYDIRDERSDEPIHSHSLLGKSVATNEKWFQYHPKDELNENDSHEQNKSLRLSENLADSHTHARSDEIPDYFIEPVSQYEKWYDKHTTEPTGKKSYLVTEENVSASEEVS